MDFSVRHHQERCTKGPCAGSISPCSNAGNNSRGVLPHAVFAREEPPADAADVAWQRTEQFEHNLAATLTWRQRMRARLSLRPFRR